jgi:hypothetical protein
MYTTLAATISPLPTPKKPGFIPVVWFLKKTLNMKKNYFPEKPAAKTQILKNAGGKNKITMKNCYYELPIQI